MQQPSMQYPGQVVQAPGQYHNAYTQNIPGGTRYVEEHKVTNPNEQSSYSYSQTQTTTGNQQFGAPQYTTSTPVMTGVSGYQQSAIPAAYGATVKSLSPVVTSQTVAAPVQYGAASQYAGASQYGAAAQYAGASQYGAASQYAGATQYGGASQYAGATQYGGASQYGTTYGTEKRTVGTSQLQTLGSTVHERIVHEGYGPEIIEHRGFQRSESVTLTEEDLKRLQWYEGHYELNAGEKVVHEKIVHEKVVEVPKYYVEEKVVEIPEYEYIDKIVEIPEKVQEEKIVHVPKIEYQERVVTVPKKIVKENIIEVPEVEYREIPYEKIVEVPEVREEVITREVAVPQYVDVPVPEYKLIAIPQEIERQIPVGVEVVSTFEYKMPKLKPRYTEIAVPIYVPRFIEVPVPAQMMDPASINEADKLAAQIASMSQKQTINLADFQKLVTTQTNVFGTIPANAQAQRLQNPDQAGMGQQAAMAQGMAQQGYPAGMAQQGYQQTYSEQRTQYGQYPPQPGYPTQPGYPAAVAR